MKIILLAKINNLGNFGDTINVKSGYARNYLIPQKKAIIANEKNITYYEKEKNKILEKEKIKNDEMESKASQLQNIKLIIFSKASNEGNLYGSIKISEIIKKLKELNINLNQKELKLKSNIKKIGKHKITLIINNIKKIETDIEVIKE
ncbi:MAG TPA: 50S ribosomal protein L9 [Candidatus Azosocius sp. HAIN]